MKRSAKFVHVFAFVALVANMFAPLITVQATTLQQMAAFNDSQPAVEFSTQQDGEGGEQPQEPAPEPQPVEKKQEVPIEEPKVDPPADTPGNGAPQEPADPEIPGGDVPPTYDCGDGNVVSDTNGDGVADAGDCPAPVPTTYDCGDGNVVSDTNGDGVTDANDCPPAPTTFDCGDGVLVEDTNGDGVADVNDCPPAPTTFDCGDGNVVSDTNGDGVADAGDCPVVGEDPEPEEELPATTSVTPVLPAFDIAACADVSTLFQSVAPSETQGITYTYSEPDENGLVIVTATLDGEDVSWANDGVIEGWSIEGSVATATINAPKCEPASPKQVKLDVKADYEIDFSRRQVSLLTQELAHLAHPGDTLVITLTITNQGDEVDGLTIDSSRTLSTDWTCEPALSEKLEEGGVVTCTAEYLITEEDMWSLSLSFDFDVHPVAQPQARGLMDTTETIGVSESLPIDIVSYEGSGSGGMSLLATDPRYADTIISASPGSYDGSCPVNHSGSYPYFGGMLGAGDHPSSQSIPDGRAPSLGWNGSVVLGFTDNVLVGNGIAHTGSGYGNSSNGDLMILERGTAAEPTRIEILGTKTNGTSTGWILVGQLTSGSNANTQYFDIDRLLVGDLEGAEFTQVRLTDLNTPSVSYSGCQSGNSGDGSPQRRNVAGADIDAVWAISSRVAPVLPTIQQQACVDGVQQAFSWTNPPSTTGVVYAITGGTGPGGAPQPGDTITVTASLATGAGYAWSTTINPAVWSFNAADNSYSHVVNLDEAPCKGTAFPVVSIGDATCVDEVGKYDITYANPANGGITVTSITPDPAAGNTQVTVTATVQTNFGWPSDLSTTGLPGSPSWVISGTTATLTFTTPAIDQNPCATPDVKITKTASPTWDLNTNDTFTYTLKVENIGDGAAESVVVEDMLIPTGLTNWSVAPETLDCEIENGLLTCNLGTLQPGANAVEITLTATVISTLACDTYTNTASVSASNEPADVLENNEDSASITVACDNDKITICHATNSDSNPYTSNNLPKSQIVSDNGHWTHTNDIWPAFSYNGEDYEARGNLALLPDCVVPMPELPTPIPAECRNGVVGAPGITFGDGGGVWEFSVDPAAPWTAGQQVSVAATTIDGVIVPDGLPTEWINAGWERVDDHTVKYTFTFETVNCTPTDMPEIAVDLAVCENGEAQPHTLSIPTAEGMTVTSVTGAGSAGMSPSEPGFGGFTFPAGNSGDVVITFTIADDFEWGDLPTGGDGEWEIVSDTTATFTFTLTANDCVPDVGVTKKVSLNADGEWTDTVEVDEPTTVYFQITVTNTGTANLADVAFEEELTGVELVSVTPDGAITWDDETELTGTIGSMSPGDTVVVVYSYEITQDHFNSGETIENCASATVDDNIDGQDCATVTIEQNPGFSLAKTAEDSTVTESGVTIVYTVTVTNTGNIDLGSFNIEDDFSHDIEDLIGPTAITGPDDVKVTRVGTSNVFQISSLPVSGVLTFELSYEVTQDDMNEGGEIENCVVELIPQFASADVSSRTVEDPENCHTITIEQNPEVEATKTTTRTTVSEADTAIDYTITVTNTGNVDLPNLEVTDELTGTATPAGVTWGDLPTGVTLVDGVPTITNLTTGQIVELTASYVVTQDDMNAGGEIENCVNTEHNTAEDEDRCVTTTIEQNPDFSLEKEASVTEVTTAPTQIIYTITVTNTGNTDLDDFVIEDVFSHGDGAIDENPFFGGKVSGPDDVTITPIEDTNKFTVSGLDQGDSASFQVIYNVTLEDMDRGETIENCIWGEEDVPQTGGSSDNLPNCAQTTIEADPEVAVAKGPVDASVSPGIDDDARVAFNIFIWNEGNISLDTVTVTDPDLGSLPATGWTAYQVTFNGAGDEVLTVVTPDTAFTYTMTGPFAPGELVTLRVVSDVIPVDQIELPASEWCGPWVNTATVTGTYANGDAIVTIDGEGETEGATTNEAEVLVNCTGLSIDKSSSVAEEVKLEPGQTFQYTLDVDNNGNTDVYNVTVTDDQINPMLTINSATINTDPVQDCAVASGDVTCEIGTLGAGESVSITISVTVPGIGGEDGITWDQCNVVLTNQAQIDGDFSLTPPPTIQISSRSITPPGDPIPSNPVSNTIECDLELELEKTAASLNDGGDGVMHAGDTITYEFEVTNNSAITLYNIDVTDQLPVEFVGDVDTIDSLAPNASETLTATYVVSQTDLDNGSVRNCADAAGSTTEGDDGTSVPANESCKTTRLEAKPSLDLEKSGEQIFGEDGRIDAGDVIEYTFTIENTGNVTLTNIEVIDLLPGLTWVDGNTIVALAPGQSEELTATYIATQTMIDIGEFQNCAIAEADGPIVDIEDLAVETRQVEEPYVESNEACDEQTFVPDPSLELEKSGEQIFGEDGRIDAGDVIEYTFTVENTGNVTLTNIEVVDLLPGLTWVGGNTIAELAPGQSEELTATYIATQAMIDIGEFQNCAIAEADGPIVDVVVPESETRQVEAPFASSKENCNEQTFVPDPSLDLAKSGEQIFGDDDRIDAGDVIEYTFTVKNTGNVTLTNIEVIDLLPGLTWVDGNTIAALAPGQSAELVATYIATQTMIDIGEFQNCAIAEADGPIVRVMTPLGETRQVEAPYVESDETCDDQIFEPDPSLDAAKTADPVEGPLFEGDLIDFTITVNNTGNTTQTEILVEEDVVLGSQLNLTVLVDEAAGTEDVTDLNVIFDPTSGVITITGNIPPTDSVTIPVTYAVTQADLDQGSVENCIGAAGDVNDDNNCVTVDELQYPAISVEKDGSEIDMTVVAPDNRIDAGDQIIYVFTIENTGNVTLTNLVLNDELIADGDWGEDGNTITTLIPGEAATRTAVFTIPQEALDLGNVENCVYLEGDGPVVAEQEIRYTSFQTEDVNDEEAFVTADDCAITPLEDGPAIDIVKTGAVLPGEDGRVDAGDVISYTFTVKNTGNVTLFDVVVDDPLAGLAWVSDPSIGTMSPGDVVELTATYVVPQSMIDAGEVHNCAGVEAESPDIERPVLTFAAAQAEDDVELVTDEDCITTDLEQEPDVALEKTGSLSLGENDELNAGDVIEYTFLVTNIGNVTLEDLEIDDPMEGVEFTDGSTIDSLAPGESVELIAEYEVPQSDVDFGMITNCADVLGMAADGTEVADDDCDTQLLDQERVLDVFVAQDCPDPAAERLAEGDFSVVYELTIVNDGTVTLHNVTMTASHEGVLNEPFPTTFAPGQSETRQWTIEATEEEFENREINIEVTVVGKTSNGASVLLASMATMQNTGEEVERTLILTCPIDVPAKPVPASPVTDLPKTGSGSVTATASVLWAAAMLSVLALGTTAVGIRRKYRS